jgi:2-hydroxycyclohexanecarboxyl-CoA dehydrogenase
MDMGLRGKNVIVTGGTSNLGYWIVKSFAKEGSNVAINSRHLEDCQDVAKEAKTLGSPNPIAVQADVTKFEQVEDMVKKVMDQYGRVDVLVNNVGWNIHGYFTDLPRTMWTEVIAKNYIHILNCFYVVLPIMMKQQSGNIISVSSIIGRRGDETEAVYAGCKSGHIGFSKSIAQQVARLGIRVNVVAPGLIPPEDGDYSGPHAEAAWGGHFPPERKKMLINEARQEIPLGEPGHPELGRVGKPQDLAMAVLFLASDVMSAHITGSVIGVDGGLYMGW